MLSNLRAAWKTAVFLFKVFPMLPSRPLDWIIPRPIVERFGYSTSHGYSEGDLYRPGGPGPHAGVLVCLGVVPFGVEHPQVPRLGEALARSGFAALLYWSPAMRDYRLDPSDIDDIASAYEALVARPDIEPERSGLLGTCVGGAFALMAASRPRISHSVSFVLAYAAYSSMWTLARDIVSATSDRGGGAYDWEVDPLTRKVFVHTVTDLLEPSEAARLRELYAEPVPVTAAAMPTTESGRAILPLLTRITASEAEEALRTLPPTLQDRLDAMSPVRYVAQLDVPLIVLLHDRDDGVVPVSEARLLRDALAGHPDVRYTEFTVFRHLDPTKAKSAPLSLARELFRFARAVQPVFRHVG